MGSRQTDFDAIISDPELAKHAADFIIRTGLLSQFKQVEPANDSGNEPLPS
jgi:hypothetical protein